MALRTYCDRGITPGGVWGFGVCAAEYQVQVNCQQSTGFNPYTVFPAHGMIFAFISELYSCYVQPYPQCLEII